MSLVEDLNGGIEEADLNAAECPSYDEAIALAEEVKERGAVIRLKRIGATPHLRFTPYENNRGVRVNMWSCISYFFEAMPERTLLSYPHIVQPWELDDWEINQIFTPWVVNQLTKQPWAKIDVLPVEESPFGSTILEWEADNQ